MRYSVTAIAILLSIFCLFGCGKGGGAGTQQQGGGNPPGKVAVSLYLFSAPWCVNCNSELPAINDQLKNLSSVQQAALSSVAYVVSGDQPSAPPTQQIADEYHQKLNVNFKFVADLPRYQEYRQFFSTGYDIPAAVVLDKNGQVLKKFAPGTYRPEEVSNFVEAQLAGVK